MRGIPRWLILAGGALAVPGAYAQTTVKCQDQNGRTVYVDRDCAVYGLRSIGSVQDRVTVAPAKPAAADDGASSPAEPQGGRQACRADAQKLCQGVKPGSGAITDCLIDHQDDISDACYAFLKAKLNGGKAPAPQTQAQPQPQADDPGEIRKRAIALCQQGRGLDCESDRGLSEWIKKETPLTEEQRLDAVHLRRQRELCEKTYGAGSDQCADLSTDP